MAGATTQIRAGVVIADRYRVIDRLGHGGMATVFLAEDLVLSRQVAVKRLHTAAAEGSAERRYEEAVPVLRRAADSFPAGTGDLTYAYALYNLGQALRLAGRPEEAIPILEQRLEIPNRFRP